MYRNIDFYFENKNQIPEKEVVDIVQNKYPAKLLDDDLCFLRLYYERSPVIKKNVLDFIKRACEFLTNRQVKKQLLTMEENLFIAQCYKDDVKLAKSLWEKKNRNEEPLISFEVFILLYYFIDNQIPLPSAFVDYACEYYDFITLLYDQVQVSEKDVIDSMDINQTRYFRNGLKRILQYPRNTEKQWETLRVNWVTNQNNNNYDREAFKYFSNLNLFDAHVKKVYLDRMISDKVNFYNQQYMNRFDAHKPVRFAIYIHYMNFDEALTLYELEMIQEKCNLVLGPNRRRNKDILVFRNERHMETARALLRAPDKFIFTTNIDKYKKEQLFILDGEQSKMYVNMTLDFFDQRYQAYDHTVGKYIFKTLNQELLHDFPDKNKFSQDDIDFYIQRDLETLGRIVGAPKDLIITVNDILNGRVVRMNPDLEYSKGEYIARAKSIYPEYIHNKQLIANTANMLVLRSIIQTDDLETYLRENKKLDIGITPLAHYAQFVSMLDDLGLCSYDIHYKHILSKLIY